MELIKLNESAYTLGNILTGTMSQMLQLIMHGFARPFFQLLKSTNVELKKLVLYCLSTIFLKLKGSRYDPLDELLILLNIFNSGCWNLLVSCTLSENAVIYNRADLILKCDCKLVISKRVSLIFTNVCKSYLRVAALRIYAPGGAKYLQLVEKYKDGIRSTQS